jgi:hypothetical protein
MVSRADVYNPIERGYFAQVKILGLWVDCRFIPFYYDLESRSFGSPSSNYPYAVEQFINAKINKSAKQIDWNEHVEREFD